MKNVLKQIELRVTFKYETKPIELLNNSHRNFTIEAISMNGCGDVVFIVVMLQTLFLHVTLFIYDTLINDRYYIVLHCHHQ